MPVGFLVFTLCYDMDESDDYLPGRLWVMNDDGSVSTLAVLISENETDTDNGKWWRIVVYNSSLPRVIRKDISR